MYLPFCKSRAHSLIVYTNYMSKPQEIQSQSGSMKKLTTIVLAVDVLYRLKAFQKNDNKNMLT